jgi:hypothetical protein
MSIRRSSTPYKPVRTLALLPLRSPGPTLGQVAPLDRDPGEQRFLSHRPLSLRSLATWTFSEPVAPQGTPTGSVWAWQTVG